MANMEHFVQRGEEVKETLNEGVQKANEIGQEISEVKDGLSDMPDGLDDDLKAMIEAAREQARQEARSEMDSAVKSDILDKAGSEAASVKGDTTQKIGDNAAAQSKLQSLFGKKYGRDAISKASGSLESNSQQGQDLISDLDRSEENARAEVERILSNI